MNKVAVYGTLKKGFGNHRVMEKAQGKFIKEDYVEINHLWTCGFPMVKFVKEGDTPSNKWLKVEIYEVDDKGVTWPLDRLEGYTEGSDWNLYNRIKTLSLSWEEVSVYEIVNDNNNVIENYFVEEKDGKLLYDWK